MKKLVAMILCVSLLLCASVAFASSVDLSGMSQDELHAVIDQARLALLQYEVYSDGDRVVFDNDGVKVTLKEVTFGTDSIELAFVYENNSEKECGIQMDDTYINGWAVYGGQLLPIIPGKKAKQNITFYHASEFDVAALSDLQDMEFTMHSFEATTYETIFKTDTVRLDFNFE